jgi:hypothetical protein
MSDNYRLLKKLGAINQHASFNLTLIFIVQEILSLLKIAVLLMISSSIIWDPTVAENWNTYYKKKSKFKFFSKTLQSKILNFQKA